MFKVVKCGMDTCRAPVTCEWQGTKENLFLCHEHFNLVASVHFYEVIEQSSLLKVRVIPDSGVRDADEMQRRGL